MIENECELLRDSTLSKIWNRMMNVNMAFGE